MKKIEINIAHRYCVIYPDEAADRLLLQPADRTELASLDGEVGQIRRRSGGRPFTFAAFAVEDWNRELSPWTAPPVYGEEGFGDGAADTLTFLLDALLPALERDYAPGTILLGGYSLAGLFALWSGYQTDRLDGVAAVSPSVWFPGWDDFAGARRMRTENVYLSLGKKEERARSRALSCVGDRIRGQYERLSNDPAVQNCVLEWNPGNHFAEPETRLAKGFAWLLSSAEEKKASRPFP